MLPFVLYLLTFITFINCKAPSGYYWKDYAGVIPSDAFAAGVDQNGKPIFIGQTIHTNHLVTVKLYSTGGKGYYPFNNQEHEALRHIKVLCTRQPGKFKWVPTTTDAVGFLAEGKLVVGGGDGRNPTYIGRIFYQLETTVGKIVPKSGIFITHDKVEVRFHSFEVLIYYPYVMKEL